MFWDYTYVFVLIGTLVCGLASLNVKSVYRRYSADRNYRGLTAERCAGIILHSADIDDVRIERVRGNLTDHYAPREKVLRLSDSVYGYDSIAALGVAAHECGHAIQHSKGYIPLKLRSLSVPLANIGSFLSWPLVLLGLILGYSGVAQFGVILFLFVVLFQLITLPVEFNASHRALRVLEDRNLLTAEEMRSARKVLRAAALTYVAALFSTVMQLFRLILLAGGNRRRR